MMAVSRVCLRDGTKTMTGFLGECFMMAWYTGLAMESRRVCVWLMLKPCRGEERAAMPCGEQAEGKGKREKGDGVTKALPGCAAPAARGGRWGGS